MFAQSRPPIPSDCPNVLADLMSRCWSLDPETRPEFSEIVRSLTEFQESLLALPSQWSKDELLTQLKIGNINWYYSGFPLKAFSYFLYFQKEVKRCEQRSFKVEVSGGYWSFFCCNSAKNHNTCKQMFLHSTFSTGMQSFFICEHVLVWLSWYTTPKGDKLYALIIGG